MTMSRQEAEGLFRRAVAALNAGRADEARAGAEALAASELANAHVLLLLATACRAQQDPAAEEAALDRLLALDPRGLRALIMKGDCRMRAGDETAAASHYRAALIVAGDAAQPPDVAAELARAEAAVAAYKAGYAGRLEAALAAQGIAPETASPRFRQSLDIIAGRRRIFLQEPTGYFFPELPHIQFFDPGTFAWAPAVEAATDAIRDEILAFRAAGGGGFRPYIRSEANAPRVDDNPLLDSAEWSTLFLCENGEENAELIAAFPNTWAAVQAAPLPRVANSGPTVMFSLLRSGARINPHTGVFNTRLICHLPLIVPPGCGFRVGNETREWEEGRLIVFDDTIEHEAWNGGGEDRIVLIFDIWRPELSEQERREVAAVLSFR